MNRPTGLDPNQILEIRDLIREIAQDHSVLLSTHILSEVEAICQSIKMIEQGKLIFSGTIDEFHDSVKSNNCIVKLENAPAEEELRNIPGVTKVKKLDEHTFRVQFEQGISGNEPDSGDQCEPGMEAEARFRWKKYLWMKSLPNYPGKRVVDKF